jgi:hypothetical protein
LNGARINSLFKPVVLEMDATYDVYLKFNINDTSFPEYGSGLKFCPNITLDKVEKDGVPVDITLLK